MTKDSEKGAKSALRSQTDAVRAQRVSVKKKRKTDPQSGSPGQDARSAQCGGAAEAAAAGQQPHKAEKVSLRVESENQQSPGAHRKLSDASNASEDLSKDSGCASGKPSSSSSDCSSEISDCVSEGNKRDSPSSENDLSWIDGRAYVSPMSGGPSGGEPCVKATAPASAAGGGPGSVKASASLLDLMMGETAEDLVREVEDLRSENEYLKDEVEELRCEMLEIRDMFQEEEVYQLQELRIQLEQAKKMCRILQYRLRKAERRSIRVAQTGQVDGELVRSLEHDIKVAKSVSLHLCNELEAVQKKKLQLERENEALREKTQELEVAKQVLQSQADKARECTLKKRSSRSTASKAEKRLSQQMEDDSADLRCQLHFAKEELTLMCKKLSKLVSESELLREELAKYQAAYGDTDSLPAGGPGSIHAREAEVKVHLKLLEEEATLLSRRIVELEVENRGLRAEMSDLREKMGGGGEEEEHLSPAAPKNREFGSETGRTAYCQGGQPERGSSTQADGTACEGSPPVRAEPDPCGGLERTDAPRHVMTTKDYELLVSLRDNSCILISSVQLLAASLKGGHSPPPSSASTPQTDGGPNGVGPFHEALELLQAMLLAFIQRTNLLLTEEDQCKGGFQKNGCVWDSAPFGSAKDQHKQESDAREEELGPLQLKQKLKQTPRSEAMDGHKDPKTQLSLQILWILHQWWNVKATNQEGKQGTDKTAPLLLRLLQDFGAELRDDSEVVTSPDEATEDLPGAAFGGGPKAQTLNRLFCPHGPQRKNWCYLSQEVAQLDPEDPVKTWDHLIMPTSFPELDLEQLSIGRSHTAPEKSTVRIYYSPPSARRVQLSQVKPSPAADGASVDTSSPWCTPPTSFSQLYLGSSTNLSDDMKEMTAGWRQTVYAPPQELRGRAAGRWVGVATAGTQTPPRPQMVSVALQTEGPESVRSSPSKVFPLVSARSNLMSASLEGLTGRVEPRARNSASSPKLCRRHSCSLASPSSSSSNSRDQALWSLSQRSSSSGLTWTSRQSSPRSCAGQNQSSMGSKPSSKLAGANRCGLVTEFLRRVSGRADKSAPGSAQRPKTGPKSLERAPARPQVATLSRSDSVTRIVNQRFMKQREDAARAQRDGSSQRVRQSPSSTTAEEGSYGCSSSSSLAFCFALPSRQNHRQTPDPAKLSPHRRPPAAGSTAGPSCG